MFITAFTTARPPVPIFSQIDPVRAPISLSKIHFNIILPSTPRSYKCFLFLQFFPLDLCRHLAPPPYMLHALSISVFLTSSPELQGGWNMTGTNCDLFTHKSSRSYLNHLVYWQMCFRCIWRGRGGEMIKRCSPPNRLIANYVANAFKFPVLDSIEKHVHSTSHNFDGIFRSCYMQWQ
jgi:hypothetical protein